MTISKETLYLTEAEASKNLLKIELEHDLFKFKVDGYSAWRILRFEAAMILQNLPLTPRDGKQSKFRRLVRELFLVFLDLPRLIFPKHAKYVVKTTSLALREREGGLMKDVYFDDLIKELDSVFKIEQLRNLDDYCSRKQMLFPAEMTTVATDLFASFMSRLFIPGSIEEVATSLFEIIRSEPALQRLTLSKIKNALNWFYWSKRFYLVLLRKIRPRYVLTLSAGSLPIWAAAQELGVETVEFQHGTFSHDHPHALPGLALPYRASLIVPDKLLVYGQYWIDELNKNQFYRHELIPVGNHRIDKYRQIRNEIAPSLRKADVCVMLITTQGLDRERLIDFVISFLRAAKSELDCKVFIKLHPRETDKKSYENAFSLYPNVEVLMAPEEPATFDLMAHSHYHCSIASTTHYDALGMGVPTIVLPLAGHELMYDLISSGHAIFVNGPEQLVDVVSNFHTVAIPPEVIDYYYSPNALQNIKRHIA